MVLVHTDEVSRMSTLAMFQFSAKYRYQVINTLLCKKLILNVEKNLTNLPEFETARKINTTDDILKFKANLSLRYNNPAAANRNPKITTI